METFLVVFLLGSAAAFLPIYWALQKSVELLAGFGGRRPFSAPSARRSAFLRCLRVEAGYRALDELQRAIGDMRQAAAHDGFVSSPLSQDRRVRMHEVRAMIGPLLSSREIAAFDRIAAQLVVGDIRQLDRIAAQVEELHALLEPKTAPPMARPRFGVHWREPALVRNW